MKVTANRETVAIISQDGPITLCYTVLIFLSLISKSYFLIASVEKAKKITIIFFNLCFCVLNIDVLKLIYFHYIPFRFSAELLKNFLNVLST